MSSNNTSNRENIEQIPKEEHVGEVQKAVSEQGGVEDQRKEMNVGDYVKASAVGQLLKNLEFPTDNNKIIQFVHLQETQTNISKEKKEDLLYILQKNTEEGKQYQNVSEITRATGLVRQQLDKQ